MRPGHSIKFKHPGLENEFDLLDGRLQIILLKASEFFKDNGEVMTITALMSNPEEDKELGRVSKSHSEARAADVRTIDLSESFITKFKKWLVKNYYSEGAVSYHDGKRRIVVDHVGTARHLHIQVSKKWYGP